MIQRKTILVAPLNWGLGHATRCIPIINELIIHGFNVILASEGAALQLLQKEFPKLETITLPSYNIHYPKNGKHFKISMLVKAPHILKTIKEEKKQVASLLKQRNIQGIISDNRWGVRSKKIPSVFLTHQINVLSGSTSKITGAMHRRLIKKFSHCWVPDFSGQHNLSGKLGHTNTSSIPIQYIGPLSRMAVRYLPKKYDLLLLLSGPEPQRTLFERKLINEFKDDARVILMVRGVVEEVENTRQYGNIKAINFLKTEALEKAINQSDIIISRSGYTTIMDLSSLGKKAFFVPTPGQYEQKYLAKRLKDKAIAPSCKQENFSKEKIKEVAFYKGLQALENKQDFGELFSLFHSK
ncbi:MAG: hypothetical protein ACI849_001457 [Patiriisocius sp.]|jgi:uncharacterized protein (TIGR00661 family)